MKRLNIIVECFIISITLSRRPQHSDQLVIGSVPSAHFYALYCSMRKRVGPSRQQYTQHYSTRVLSDEACEYADSDKIKVWKALGKLV